MKINELQARQAKVDIEVEVVDKGDIREFEKFGRAGKVCSCTAKDETGQITLTLWNEDIEKVNAGDKVKIENGYVGEWQGDLQLSTGKFGKMEVVGKGEAPAEAPAEESAPSEPAEEEKKETPEEISEEPVSEEEEIK